MSVVACLAASPAQATPVDSGEEDSVVVHGPNLWTPSKIEFTVTVAARVRFLIMEAMVEYYGYEPDRPKDLSYDVQVRRGSMFAARPSAWRTAIVGTTKARQTFPLRGGRALCVRARQHSYGVTGPWGEAECLVRGRDDSKVRRSGPMKVVKERKYADDRATALMKGGVLRMRVPKGARYGIVVTQREGDAYDYPGFGLSGTPVSPNCRGGFGHTLEWCARRAPHRGTLVVRNLTVVSNPVGALFVIPRWVR
jgi:hypothetical protein